MRAGAPIGMSKLRLFAETTGGYSFVFVPPDEKFQHRGFIFGVGGGASYAIARKTAVTFALDYQFGFQSVSSPAGTVDESDSLLELSLGVITQVRWGGGD